MTTNSFNIVDIFRTTLKSLNKCYTNRTPQIISRQTISSYVFSGKMQRIFYADYIHLPGRTVTKGGVVSVLSKQMYPGTPYMLTIGKCI